MPRRGSSEGRGRRKIDSAAPPRFSSLEHAHPEGDVTAELGAQLREARLERGLSLRSLAEALGVSASLISQVETGKTQPSVSTLYAMVNHLGISMDQLLGLASRDRSLPASEPQASVNPAIQRVHDGPVLEMENGVKWERLAVGEGGPVDPMLVTYEQGARSSIEGRMMRHSGVEYAYILGGQLTLQLDFDTFVLGPGDSLQFDSMRPHMYTNHGKTAAQGIWFVVGRRHQNQSMPSAAEDSGDRAAGLGSAVDVLRAMDDLHD